MGAVMLKTIRKNAGKSKKDVAEHVGLSVSQYKKIEKDFGRATLAQARAICKYLGAKVLIP